MVLVAVGNAQQKFTRLLEAVEALIESGQLAGETVFMQTGNTDFVPRHCQHQAFLEMEDFNRRLAEADLLICHGGAGTQLQAVRLGKVPVVMPRREKYQEHVNDHQVQLVEALAAEGYIVPAFEVEDLAGAILKSRQIGRQSVFTQSPMLQLVAEAISELEHK